ncbi:MAG: hypothetical protein ABIS08_01620 [Pseudolysinimonas sp.]
MTDQVDRLLAEAQLTDDPQLRGMLIELHRAATSVRPMPSAELTSLMTPRRRRPRTRRRGGLVTAMVAVGMLGVGVTAAAASPEVRSAAQQAYQVVTGAIVSGTVGFTPHDNHGAPGAPTAPSRRASPSPHPSATDRPGPGDHPGNGATNAATPPPKESHGGASGHPTAQPSGGPGKSRKP